MIDKVIQETETEVKIGIERECERENIRSRIEYEYLEIKRVKQITENTPNFCLFIRSTMFSIIPSLAFESNSFSFTSIIMDANNSFQ